MRKILNVLKILVILSIGGFGYALIETLVRGFTHWSMIMTGAAVFLTLYYLNKQFKDTPLTLKAIVGSLIITLYELLAGVIVNLWFKMNVWDYSHFKYDLWGQICPRFVAIWFVLCFILATSDYIIRKIWYTGYKLFIRKPQT